MDVKDLMFYSIIKDVTEEYIKYKNAVLDEEYYKVQDEKYKAKRAETKEERKQKFEEFVAKTGCNYMPYHLYNEEDMVMEDEDDARERYPANLRPDWASKLLDEYDYQVIAAETVNRIRILNKVSGIVDKELVKGGFNA